MEPTYSHAHPHSLGTILSVWAHPDDETFLAGGIMASARDNGQRVVCVSATAGEHGTDDVERWPPERLARVRRVETRAAMAALGIDEHRWLDLPDGGLADVDPAAPVARLRDLIREVRPDSILTFGPDGMTFHPDHRTVSAWVTAAWNDAGRPGRLLYAAYARPHLDRWADTYEEWSVYMTDERPVGVDEAELAVHHRLTGDLLDRKLVALGAMRSQTAATFAALGEDVLAEECSVESFVDAPGPVR